MGRLFSGAIYEAQKYLENRGTFDKDPEGYHHKALDRANKFDNNGLVKSAIRTALGYEHPNLKQELRGQEYKNPIGLAAGFTKEADGLQFLEAFGFGYLVIGGITGDAQEGNPKPRLFRYTDRGSVINRMGLPGSGVDAMVQKLAKRKSSGERPTVPVRINLVNSLSTTVENKPDEFGMMVEKLYPYADVFELNFSCPNQKGVTDIQKGGLLKQIIQKAQATNERIALSRNVPKKPIVIKLGPLSNYNIGDERQKDLSVETLEQIVDVCIECKVDGIVATNTAQEHIGIPSGQDQTGGMSGALLRPKSRQTVRNIKEMIGKNSDIKIIGVGGIGTGNNKKEIGKSGISMMRAGADLQQMLTGFVMGGTVASPYIVKKALADFKKSTFRV